MTVFGIILIILGFVCFGVGMEQNNDMEAQLESFFESGRTNPGDTLIIIGIALVVLGIIFLIIGLVSKNKKHPVNPPYYYNNLNNPPVNYTNAIPTQKVFCMHCGNPMPQGTKFCSNCGKQVGENNQNTVQEPHQNFNNNQF